MTKFIDGIVNRLYVGYRFSMNNAGRWDEYEIIGSHKIRKNYYYIVKNAKGEKESLNRDAALSLMEKGEMKVHAM